MKRIIILLANVLVCIGTYAQIDEEYQHHDGNNNEIVTILGNKKVSHGGYGAVSVNYSLIEDKDAIIIGGRGSWVIGHWFALGVGGNGFFNDYTPVNYTTTTRDVNLSGGYGGLVFEPILFPKFPVHISLPVLAGAGGIAYATSDYSPEYEDWDYFVEDADAFFVVEPGVELELNMLKYFRLCFGGYYRYTTPIDIVNTSEGPLNGFSGGITLKFGKF
ncbi:MAG: hypothetical protein JXB49_12285 [Bacteroidales bacterium]|nr:hypothetical protein [Bacteroidales bacterium]